jgi:hypothetical protein
MISLVPAALAIVHVTCWIASAGAPETREALRDKTLVAWASPANLTQRGGSVLTINDGRGPFDGIVFAERAPAKCGASTNRVSSPMGSARRKFTPAVWSGEKKVPDAGGVRGKPGNAARSHKL